MEVLRKEEMKDLKNEIRSLENQLKLERIQRGELEMQLQQKDRDLSSKVQELEKKINELLGNEEKMKNHYHCLLAKEQKLRKILEEQMSSYTCRTHIPSIERSVSSALVPTIPTDVIRSSSPPRYTKTLGSADMSGELFEVKLATVIFLRAVNRALHFFLASNLQAADKFDDLVFRYESDVTSGWKTTLIQLKHKQDNWVGRDKLLHLNQNSNFSLIKYCNSYLNVKNAHQSNDDLKFLGDFDDFEFVLYTNASVEGVEYDHQSSESLIATGKQGQGYTLHHKKDSDIFQVLREMASLKELLIEIQNMSGTESGEIDWKSKLAAFKLSKSRINAELQQKLCSLKKIVNINDISTQLKDFVIVSDFSLYEEFFERFQLFSKQADQKELDGVIEREIQIALGVSDQLELSRIASDVTKAIESWAAQANIRFLTQESEFWKEIVLSRIKHISHAKAEEYEESMIRFEQSSISSLQHVLPKSGILNIISSGKSTDLSCLKVHQALLGYDDKQSIFISLGSLLDRQEEVLHLWQNRFCRTLVVDCGSDLDKAANLCLKLIGIVKKTVNLRVVLVSCNDISLSDFFKSDKLNYDEVRDDCRWSELTDDSQDDLVRRTVRFQGVQVPLNLLIDQDERLSKQLRGDTLCRLLSDEMVLGLELPPPIEYYIPRKLVRSGVTVDVESVDDISEKLVLIAAEPGMGKSTLLTQLAYSAKQDDPSTWVMRVNLNDCSEYLKRVQNNAVELTQPLEFLSKFGLNMNTNSHLEEALLEHCLNTSGKIIIFLDGVDEIAPYYKTEISLIIKNLLLSKFRSIWVTSRLAVCDLLENVMNVKAFNFQTFTKNDQNIFLQRFWHQKFTGIPKDHIKSFTERVLELAANAFRGENLVISIPQQTRMLGEYFEDQLIVFRDAGEIKLSEKLNLMSLYQHFVDKKLEVYAREKRKEDPTNAFNLGANETLCKIFFQDHKMASLILLLSSEDLRELNISTSQNADILKRIQDGREKSGIIDKIIGGKPHFIHRTFAEYFAAVWFSENCINCQQFIKEHLFLPEFEVIKEMFDRLLSADFPLHSAVISCESELVEKLLSSGALVDEPDNGGRTALHLSAIYGHTHSAYKQITQVLLDHGASIDTQDKVLNFRPLQYADATDSWTVAGLLMQKGGVAADFKQTESNLTAEVYAELLDFITGRVQGYCGILHSAARYGELRVLKFLMNEVGADVNIPQEGDVTPLHRASEGGNVEVLRYLVGKGASLKLSDSNKRIALHYAAQHGQLEAIEYLVEQGSDVNCSDKDGWSPALIVTQQGILEAMQYFEAKNVTVKSTTEQLGVALLWAVFMTNLGSAKSLLNRKAQVNHVDDKGTSPLHWAVMNNDFEMVELLIKKRANLNVANSEGKTPLNMSLSEYTDMSGVKFDNEKWKIFQLLIQHGASIRSIVIWSSTLIGEFMVKLGSNYRQEGKVVAYLSKHVASLNEKLQAACESGSLAEVKRYIDLGANESIALDYIFVRPGNYELARNIVDIIPECIHQTDSEGRALLHHATFHGHTQTVQLLINKGSDINRQDLKGNSALILAVMSRDGSYFDRSSTIQCLLDAGVDVELSNHHGANPLLIAAYSGNLRAVQTLITAGCNVDARCHVNEVTPLMMAAQNGHEETLRVLIEAGADLDATCSKGCPVFHYGAYKRSGLAVLKMLSSGEDFDVDKANKSGTTALMIACEHASLDVIRYLLEMGADIKRCTRDGVTCLHSAVVGGNLETIEFLVSQGVDVQAVANNNRTALDYARMNNLTPIIKYLESRSQ